MPVIHKSVGRCSVVSFTDDFLSVALFWIGFVALPCSHCHVGKDPSLVKFLEKTGNHLLIQYLDKQYSDSTVTPLVHHGFMVGTVQWQSWLGPPHTHWTPSDPRNFTLVLYERKNMLPISIRSLWKSIFLEFFYFLWAVVSFLSSWWLHVLSVKVRGTHLFFYGKVM